MARGDYDIEEDLDESSIYDEDGREDLVADDEMSAEEEGFMRGYDEADDEDDEDYGNDDDGGG
ncbi:hypothetical protein KY358_01025 [Candidatus Woesearchaeota archaeon]|nr:hypothetical protein [Candidatus Woesearchaeota archaeon]